MFYPIFKIDRIFYTFYKILVNGDWGEFSEWDECPVTCGGAEHSRHRECNNPAPAHGGHDCTADGSTNVETETCNENPCPGRLLHQMNILKVNIFLLPRAVSFILIIE